MVRFLLELIYYFTYFSPSSHLTLVCFFPVGLSLLIQHFSTGLEARRQKKLQDPLKMLYLQRKAYRKETQVLDGTTVKNRQNNQFILTKNDVI